MSDATTDTGKKPIAFAARRGTGTYHHVDEDGLSLCGVVFSRQNDRQSKEEPSAYWTKRRSGGRLVEKPQPQDRKPWYKWDSETEIDDEYNECGMCQNILHGKTDGETREEIVMDIREMIGLNRNSPSFSKDELTEIRAALRNNE